MPRRKYVIHWSYSGDEFLCRPRTDTSTSLSHYSSKWAVVTCKACLKNRESRTYRVSAWLKVNVAWCCPVGVKKIAASTAKSWPQYLFKHQRDADCRDWARQTFGVFARPYGYVPYYTLKEIKDMRSKWPRFPWFIKGRK